MHGDAHYRLGLYYQDIRMLGGDLEYSVLAAREVSIGPFHLQDLGRDWKW